ncbi:MAG TPA: hypothetical protein VGI21_08775 [Streptosporangiaceae bacterium]|jgi:hypothetical protein
MNTVDDASTYRPVLALSNERDAAAARLIAAERAAFARGYTAGARIGYERAEADMAARWNRIAAPIARGGPQHAELELRRWGTGGRASFGDPQPGDHRGGPVRWDGIVRAAA